MSATKRVRCPQIMQMEALECGAASLAMIAAYYGKWVPLEQVRTDCGVSRDGANALNIVRAARSYGFVAQGCRLEPVDLPDLPLPCIIHWNLSHFVVFCGFKGKHAVINDPARGTVSIPREQFDKSFTGIALTFEPGPGFKKEGKPRSILSFVLARMKGMAAPFAFVLLAGLLTSLCGVLGPVFSRFFVDEIFLAQRQYWLGGLLFFMIITAIVSSLVRILETIYLLKIQGKFAISANAQFLWHVLRLPIDFFNQRMAGDIAMRQQSNQNIAATLLQTLAPQVINFLMLFVYLVAMVRYSFVLTAVGIAALLGNFALSRYISKRRIAISRVSARDQSRLAGATVAGISQIETIKASGAETGFFEHWAGFHAAVNTQITKFSRLNSFLGGLPEVLGQLMNIAMLGIGAFLIISGKFSVGMFLAFQALLSAFMYPITSLVGAGQVIQEMRTDMERIEDVMKYKREEWNEALPVEYPEEKVSSEESAGDSPGVRYDKLSGSLSLRNISFGYSRLDAPFIADFNLELKKGQSVALVGSTGCGKSTVGKLVSGLYKPWGGDLLFDGVPISQIPRDVLIASVAVVTQDVQIFADTVVNNITMWDRSIDELRVNAAARDAQIHEDIMLLSKGFNHRLLEGGRDLSGGQRQRLDIARSLAGDPSIIVLDEATSALDARTEADVMEAIRRRGLTCVIVAHRLSTIRSCDEIIVMEQGKIVERGTHDSLYAADGLYTKLINME